MSSFPFWLGLGLLCWPTASVKTAVVSERFLATGPMHAGEAIRCDLPVHQHLRNASGRDGLGLCVFTSIEHAARWANEPALLGFRDYMTAHPGGGWPAKVDDYLPRCAASRGRSVPPYVQHTGGDPEFLRLALKTDRYVCVTYAGRDGVFYAGPINHMVNLVHWSDQWAVIHDNNFPGQWLWMPPEEFLQRWKASGGWAIVLLKPGPPPIPINRVDEDDAGQRGFHRVIRSGVPVCEVPAASAAPCSSELQWFPDARDPGYFYLYAGNRQLGTWHPDGCGYRRLLADGSWSSPDVPPIPLPSELLLNFGLDPGKISNEPGYQLNGRNVSRQEAFSAMRALADDSGHLRLTIVGEPTFRERILKDLDQHPRWLALRQRLRVQDYPEDHWAVAEVGFARGITLQPAPDQDGKAPVLFRMSTYTGPEPLLAAIRKADPLYRPDRDPDPSQPTPVTPTKPDLTSLPTWKAIPVAVWLFLALLALYLISQRKEQP